MNLLSSAAPLDARALELQALVDALNAAPDRIAGGMTVADLESMGVPRDLVDGIRAEMAAGKPEDEAVLAFLEQVAKTAIGDAFSKEVKRAIRAVRRRVRDTLARSGRP